MSRQIVTVALFLLSQTLVECDVQRTQIPQSLQACLTKDSVVPFSDEQISSSCLLQFLWENRKLCDRVSNETFSWLESLVNNAQPQIQGASGHSRQKRQALPRQRREYRMLSNRERNDYHRAINSMKSDTSVRPNKYDGFVSYHVATNVTAHKGVAFTGWHRYYLVLYELALQEQVPGMMLPYWDSTLDREMRNPSDSVIFTDLFLGNPREVTSQPFGHWTPKIRRSVGRARRIRIAQRSEIERIIEQSPDQKTFVGALETIHDWVHGWIGGDMTVVASAPRDPIFYMHHAFIDCVWEMYRDREKSLGRNPEIYPPQNNQDHQPNVRMKNLPAINGVFQKNVDGYKNFWTETYYTCSPLPSCSFNSPECGSDWLECDIFSGRCVSKGSEAALPRVTDSTIFDVQNSRQGSGAVNFPSSPQNSRQSSDAVNFPSSPPMSSDVPSSGPDIGTSTLQKKITGEEFFKIVKQLQGSSSTKSRVQPPPIAIPQSHSSISVQPLPIDVNTASDDVGTFSENSLSGKLKIPEFERSCVGEPNQNSFGVDCDVGTPLWSFLPVKVVNLRHGKVTYSSYPIDRRGNIRNFSDVYTLGQQLSFATNLQTEVRANRQNCNYDKSGLTNILISSYGLNYEGIYQDNIFVDNRRMVSSEISYIGIKTPHNGTTKVFLTATDECGIACQPMVQNHRRPLRYTSFPGAVEISTNGRIYHSSTPRGAEALVWKDRGRGVPLPIESRIPIVFYCDYREKNPWS